MLCTSYWQNAKGIPFESRRILTHTVPNSWNTLVTEKSSWSSVRRDERLYVLAVTTITSGVNLLGNEDTGSWRKHRLSIFHRDLLTCSIFAWCEGLIVQDASIMSRCDRLSGWSRSAGVSLGAATGRFLKAKARGTFMTVGRRHKRVLGLTATGVLDKLGRGTPRRAIDTALSP